MFDYGSSIKHKIKGHVSSVHEGKKPFTWGVCDHRSTRKGDLKKHIASVYEGYKPFKCEVCEGDNWKRFCPNIPLCSVHWHHVLFCESIKPDVYTATASLRCI